MTNTLPGSLSLAIESGEFPRRFVPKGLRPASWHDLSPFAHQLLALNISTRSEAESWLSDYAEFQNIFLEAGSRRYIEMTCDTENTAKENDYLHFVENLDPEYKKFEHAVKQKVNACPVFQELDPVLYERWRRSVQTELELFRPENLEHETAVARLSQSYQKLCGSLSADWHGQKKTVSQLSPYLQEPDRAVRREAWLKAAGCYKDNAPEMNRLFNEMFSRRKQIAANLSLPNFRDYCFRKYERTDYTPDDCSAYHQTVKDHVVPLYRDIMEHRRQRLGLSSLRPWDTDCDLQGRAPLKPFENISELRQGAWHIFAAMDPELHGFFRSMEQNGLLDLDNRMGKAPGGYQSVLDEVRLPFIFMNAVRTNQDVFTLLHECGHAFHCFLTRHFPLSHHREAAMEFSEVASMSMERFGMKYLAAFYPPEEAARAVLMEDEDVFRLLIWVAIVDRFQHWIYTHPEHSNEERNSFWTGLLEDYGYGIDWSGIEEYRSTSWHRQLHIFEYPFYYIEYGIAQFGAIQFWSRFETSPQQTIQDYKKALQLGGTRGLKELFNSAGLKFDFSPSVFVPVINRVFEEWRRLSDISG